MHRAIKIRKSVLAIAIFSTMVGLFIWILIPAMYYDSVTLE